MNLSRWQRSCTANASESAWGAVGTSLGEQRHAATTLGLELENVSRRRNRGEKVDRKSVAPSDESARYRDRHAVEPLLRDEADRGSMRAAR